MKRYLIPMLICFAASGLIAAGCGGDDDDDGGGGGGEALSKADFLAQGNQICSDGNEKIEAAFGEIQSTPDQAEQIVTDQVVPAIQGQIDGLSDLTPPEGDEDQVNQILDDAQSALDQVEEDPSLITGDGDPFAQANQEANAYGLAVCGS